MLLLSIYMYVVCAFVRFLVQLCVGSSVFLVTFHAALKCAPSLNLELADLASLASCVSSGDPCVLSEALGLQGVLLNLLDLMWVLGTQTPDLTLTQ